MSRRQDWNRARRTALDGQSTWRAERKAKDDRCSALGVQVALALQERAAWVAQCEQRAGQALTELVEAEGLSVGEAVRWWVTRDRTRRGGNALVPGPGWPRYQWVTGSVDGCR